MLTGASISGANRKTLVPLTIERTHGDVERRAFLLVS